MTGITLNQVNAHWSERTLLKYGAISIFLHLFALTLFGLVPNTQSDKPVSPLVNVRLIESKPSSEGEPQEESPTPLMKHIKPSLVPSPKPLTTGQFATKAAPLQLTAQTIMQPVHVERKPLQQTPRRILKDTHATNALRMRSFLKVASSRHQMIASRTHLPTEAQLDLATHITKPMVPHISSTSRTTHSQPSLSRHVSRPNLLMAKPPGSTVISRSTAGWGRTIPPIYPLVAREQGWEGTVKVRVMVLKDGKPGEVRIRKSSGHEVLDKAAVDAVRTWHFIPAQDGNIPVKSVVEIPINFDLRTQEQKTSS